MVSFSVPDCFRDSPAISPSSARTVLTSSELGSFERCSGLATSVGETRDQLGKHGRTEMLKLTLSYSRGRLEASQPRAMRG